jgi:methyl-accepting chemotaxis protein
MTGEEMERAIKFLLASQAQLTANVGSLSETVDRLSGTVGNLSGTLDKLSERVDQIAETVDRTTGGITALLAIAEIHEREIGALNEASRATDEKLNALISTVERFISRRGES